MAHKRVRGDENESAGWKAEMDLTSKQPLARNNKVFIENMLRVDDILMGRRSSRLARCIR